MREGGACAGVVVMVVVRKAGPGGKGCEGARWEGLNCVILKGVGGYRSTKGEGSEELHFAWLSFV